MYFMFYDKEYVKKLVNMRDDDKIVIPLYIQIFGKKYSLLQLDAVKKRFSKNIFKVGYATADALFMNNSFPVNRIGEFDLIDTFTEYDTDMERNIRYTVFESGDVDVKEDNELDNEIHMYFDCLFNRVKSHVDEHFKSLIEQDDVPIIPKEKPEKEVVPLQVGIKEYTGELSKYSSSCFPKFVNEKCIEPLKLPESLEEFDRNMMTEQWIEHNDEEDENEEYIEPEIPEHIPVADEDDEDIPYPSADDVYDEYVEEDPLNDLRKEISEYSQDDNNEDNNTDDDYLSENNYTKSMKQNEAFKYSDDNDYSTDFDIF